MFPISSVILARFGTRVSHMYDTTVRIASESPTDPAMSRHLSLS